MKSEIATYVNPSGLIAFIASRLIAFDKCPGVCPIGVGEVIKKLFGMLFSQLSNMI